MTDEAGKKQVNKAPNGAVGAVNRNVDWEAVERDYRTTKMTLRELGSLYNVNHSAIAHKVKKLGWKKDLTEAVRQATSALLIEEAVTNAVTNAVNSGQQVVTNSVLAVAELRKQVIVSHRSRLTDLADAVDFAKGVLLTQGANIENIRDAATLVQAVGGLSTATKNLIDKEREAYQLNEKDDDKPEQDKNRYTDAERAVKLAYLLSKVPA